MKKLILAGILILICCSVFLIIRQNSSRADITRDVYNKTYPVPFGDWVSVWVKSEYRQEGSVLVKVIDVEGKFKFTVFVSRSSSEIGQRLYQAKISRIKNSIKAKCKTWTAQGYPISLNDFVFVDIPDIPMD